MKPVQVWQVCQCEVTDKRDYCVTCFTSKSAHLAEAMRDEDTFLRHSDLRLQAIKIVSSRDKDVKGIRYVFYPSFTIKKYSSNLYGKVNPSFQA